MYLKSRKTTKIILIISEISKLYIPRPRNANKDIVRSFRKTPKKLILNVIFDLPILCKALVRGASK